MACFVKTKKGTSHRTCYLAVTDTPSSSHPKSLFGSKGVSKEAS
jgi:hypothetical protein